MVSLWSVHFITQREREKKNSRTVATHLWENVMNLNINNLSDTLFMNNVKRTECRDELSAVLSQRFQLAWAIDHIWLNKFNIDVWFTESENANIFLVSIEAFENRRKRTVAILVMNGEMTRQCVTETRSRVIVGINQKDWKSLLSDSYLLTLIEGMNIQLSPRNILMIFHVMENSHNLWNGDE